MKTTQTTTRCFRNTLLTLPVAAAVILATLGAPATVLAQAPNQAMNAAADPTCQLLVGYSFTYPRDWSVTKDQPTGYLKVVQNGAGSNEAYIVGRTSSQGAATAEDPRCAQVAETEMRTLVPGLHRIGGVERFRTGVGPGVLVQMEGPNNAGVPIYTTILMAVHGNDALFLIAIGPKETVHSRLKPLLNLFASMHAEISLLPIGAASPVNYKWTQRLSGRKLTILSGYSSGSSGGFNGSSEWWLNADGKYTFHSTSSVSIYVPGATGGSASEHRAAGTWRVVEMQGVPMLELRPDGGSVQTYRMEYRNSQTFMNGRRVYVTAQ